MRCESKAVSKLEPSTATITGTIQTQFDRLETLQVWEGLIII